MNDKIRLYLNGLKPYKIVHSQKDFMDAMKEAPKESLIIFDEE